MADGTKLPDLNAVRGEIGVSAGVASAYVSGTTANPRNPTASELVYNAAPRGSRRTLDGGIQPLVWSAGAWVTDGAATLGSTGAVPRLTAVGTVQAVTLADRTAAGTALDSYLAPSTDAGLIANQSLWSTFVGLMTTIGGRFSLAAKKLTISAPITQNNAKGLLIDGEGGSLQQTQANTRSLVFTNASDLTIQDLGLNGVGTEWDGTSAKNAGRGLYVATGSNVIVQRAKFNAFSYAAIYHNGVSNTWTLDSQITGLGEYNAASNPRGLTNYVTNGGTNTADGNYSFGILLQTSTATPNHWVSRNLFKNTGTGVDGTTDIKRLSIVDNKFDNIPGQHGCYIPGASQLTYALNQTYAQIFDGIKNVLQSGGTQSGDAAIFAANSFIGARAASWGINQSVLSGTFRHRSTALLGNSALDSVGGGFTIRNTDGFVAVGNTTVNMGTYGMYTLDSDGVIAAQHSDGSGNCGLYVGTRANKLTLVNGVQLQNYNTAPTGTLTNAQRSAITITGPGTTRLSEVTIGSTTGTPYASIYVEDVTSTLELARTVVAPTTLPVVSLGAIAAIDGPHIGQIYSNAAATTPFNFADGAIRRGRGPGREFNGSAPPTGGTTAYRRRDICWNTNPISGSYAFWLCTADGTPGTWVGIGPIP